MSTRTVDATFVFAPGKFNAAAEASARYYARLVKHYDAAALLTTESQAKGIAKATRKAVPTHHVGKRGEYLALWRKSDVDSIGPAKLHHLTATKGLAAWRNLRVMSKPLVVADIPIDFMAGHAPSGVQDGAKYRSDRPLIVRTSKDGLHAWGNLIERGKTAQIAMLDSNLDQHLKAWRRYLEDSMESESVWDEPGHLPKGGSHGRRLIDTIQFRDSDDGRVRLEVLDAGIDRGARPKGFDHNAIWVTFRITLHEGKPPVTKQQKYPKANATTQWFQGRYPGSRMDANCGVLHTTETTGWPGYAGGATAPNLTTRPNMAAKRLEWRQHFDMDRSSRALQNDAGGVETNTLNAAQVELVGTCDPRHRASWNGLRAGVDYIYWPDAPDWALSDLADFLRWCEAEHGIPLAGVKRWLAYPASYGQSNPNRLTFAQWRNLYGWCGHQHVPENDHGDPGDLDFARVLELAKPTAPVKPAKPPRKKRPKHVREIIKHARAQRKGRNPKSVLRRRMDQILDIAKKINKR